MSDATTILSIHDDAELAFALGLVVRSSTGGPAVDVANAVALAEHVDGTQWQMALVQWPLAWASAADLVALLGRRYPLRPLVIVAATPRAAVAASTAGCERVVGAAMADLAALNGLLDALARAAPRTSSATTAPTAPTARTASAPAAPAAASRPTDPAALAASLQGDIDGATDLEQMRGLSKQLLAVCIDQLRDGQRALSVCLAWRERDPDNEDLQRIVVSMLHRLERWPDLVDALSQLADSDVAAGRVGWLLQLADVYEHRLANLAAARDVLDRVLTEPELGDGASRTAITARRDGLMARLPDGGARLELVREVPGIDSRQLRHAVAIAADALRATGPITSATMDALARSTQPPPVPIARSPAAVAHDLAAPARAVARYLEAALEDHGDQLNADATDLLQRAHAAAQRLQTRVATALGADTDLGPGVGAAARTRQNPAESAVAGETIEVDDLLRDVLADLSAELDAADATVRYETLPTLCSDREGLRRVLQNLLANAIVHGGPSPQIDVSAVANAAGWELLVRDRGPGLAAGVDIFASGARRDGSPGKGLGLAICRDLVAQLGGRIGARSAVGGGTVVHFTLPGSTSPPPAAKAPAVDDLLGRR